ncbi:MAG: DeoR/GlpR family DNA-binding transcription regulator [Bacillota bacterium]|nr:DeoR/GlpR family DNA-binding transcription regulator [Bacillota bacterium]
MLKKSRQEYILNQLNQFGFIKINEIQEQLNVTEMTIRRDLTELEQKGKLIRVHGGAQKIKSPSIVDLEHEARKIINQEKKEIIARKAASLIQDNDVLFISASTTNEMIYPYVKAKNVTVVTNCIYIFFQYSNKPNFEAILIGGKYNTLIQSFLGTISLRTISTMNFTKAFVGANGINDNTLSASNDEESLFHSMAMDRSLEKYIVCDSTKFNTNSFYNFYTLDKVTAIITDTPDIEKIHDYRELTNII